MPLAGLFMRNHCLPALVLFLFLSGIAHAQPAIDRYPIIPRPNQLIGQPGSFLINSSTLILIPANSPEVRAIGGQLMAAIQRVSGLEPTIQTASSPISNEPNQIQFVLLPDSLLGTEGYRLTVTERLIRLEASQSCGLFYAVQSLLQLMPVPALGSTTLIEIPACQIQDQPRYAYRGLHLDVSRHFFPVAFIKKYIDQMARYKFNQFHWHLTDDQGWRIEIKKYPKLTEIGAIRRETIVGHYEEYDPQVFDGKPYGGFYTQDEIREVVRYAQERYVNIIPEIEMPGHALSILASYPELGCPRTDGITKNYQVATKWGVFGDVLCPSEPTFSFLEDVLTEVMALFPSTYIHIGGDECPKQTWRNSPYCQRLMRREGLRNAHELQRYFIKRIDAFLISRGRKLLGWDEILQGSNPKLRLSTGATVMSWRGVQFGIQAARQGHPVVMTPDKFCYLNYFQSEPGREPLAFGGYLPIQKVYSFDPTPIGLTPAQQRLITGAQACLWTEYISTPEQVEYMIWPRAAALAEVVWTQPPRKDYANFLSRLPAHLSHFQVDGIHYSQTALSPLPKEKRVSKSTGKPYVLLTQPNNSRPDRGGMLTDGVLGTLAGYEVNDMVSFWGRDFGVVIDLGQSQPVQTVSVGFVKYTARDICLPKQVAIALSDDGQAFQTVGTFPTDATEQGKRAVVRMPFTLPLGPSGRYVRVTAKNVGRVPVGMRHPGAVAKLAIDEVSVD